MDYIHTLSNQREVFSQLKGYFEDPASASLATHIALILALVAFVYQKSSFSMQNRSNIYNQKRDDYERYLSHAWISYVDLLNSISRARFVFEKSELPEIERSDLNRFDSYLADIRLARYQNEQVSVAVSEFSQIVRACRLELTNLDNLIKANQSGLKPQVNLQSQFDTIKSFPDKLNSSIELLENAFASDIENSRPKTFDERIKLKFRNISRKVSKKGSN